jgi:ribose transport system permease protein
VVGRGLIQTIGLVAALLILFFGFGILLYLQDKGGFISVRNIETILRQSTPVCIAALGMTLVIVSAGIDLSVGSIVAFVSVVVAWCLQREFSPWIACLGGLAAGCAFGLLNGLLVSRLKVGPFIVTLATMLVARGAAKGLAGEQKIDAPMTWVNDLLSVLGSSEKWRLLPYGVWVMVGLACLTHFTLFRTRFGRHIVAVGSNERAAQYSGIQVDGVKLAVYVAMGLMAGFAGIMMFARLSVGDPTTAQGFELSVIAAVVIGGASLSGGQGSILGSILGALIMATINAGCSQLGLANWIQEMITGGIIVVSVLLDRLRVRRSA